MKWAEARVVSAGALKLYPFFDHVNNVGTVE